MPEATEINDKFNQLLDAKKLKIVIDLEQVEWMNSSGLGILIQASTLLRNNQGRLKLVNVSERIQNLLKITKLSGIFETSGSIEEAISSLNNFSSTSVGDWVSCTSGAISRSKPVRA